MDVRTIGVGVLCFIVAAVTAWGLLEQLAPGLDANATYAWAFAIGVVVAALLLKSTDTREMC